MIPQNFRTSIPDFPVNHRFDYHDQFILMGSCFSENIGNHLWRGGFRVCRNPFGILFNPVSISKALERIVVKKHYTVEELVKSEKLFHSPDHHGLFSAPNSEDVLSLINNRLDEGRKALIDGNVLTLSLGTAHVYRYKKTLEIVANCHKIPSGEFRKELLKVSDIKSSLRSAIEMLREHNPSIQIVLTVSPIRHIKDGLVADRRSKSVLIVAAHELSEEIENAIYYPSYEMLTDDLRDYRFYADDLIHPSNIAKEYIREHFVNSFVKKEAIIILEKINAFNKMLEHRPIHPNSSKSDDLSDKLIEQFNTLQSNYPEVNFDYQLLKLKERGLA